MRAAAAAPSEGDKSHVCANLNGTARAGHNGCKVYSMAAVCNTNHNGAIHMLLSHVSSASDLCPQRLLEGAAHFPQ